MVPQRTLQTSQWPLFETCFPGNSFPVSETCRSPLVLLIFQRVIFSFGGIWNLVFTITNPVRWMIWRKPSIRKFVWLIVSCWPMSWMILKNGLKTASKKMVVILTISFLKLNHLVWHVLSFNFVWINVNLLEKQLSTIYFKDVRFPWVTLYFRMLSLCTQRIDMQLSTYSLINILYFKMDFKLLFITF